MEISEVRALMLSCPVEPIMDAVNFIPYREALLVRVETDRGLIGIGEAACFGGALRTVKAIVEGELRPLLVGEDPLRIERLWDRMYSRTFQHGRRGAVIGAISGVDIALWDILGQVAGLPLYRLLGGYRSQIRAYASGGFYQEGKGPRELAQEMARYAAVGFQGVKMKVGRNPSAWIGRGAKGVLLQDQLCLVSPEEDLERVAAVREAIGQEVELMVMPTPPGAHMRLSGWFGSWRGTTSTGWRNPSALMTWRGALRWRRRHTSLWLATRRRAPATASGSSSLVGRWGWCRPMSPGQGGFQSASGSLPWPQPTGCPLSPMPTPQPSPWWPTCTWWRRYPTGSGWSWTETPTRCGRS